MSQRAEHIEAERLHQWLLSDEEIAVIDVREQGVFGQGHLLRASNLPYGRLEIMAPSMIPRRSTKIVVCDDAQGPAHEAAELLLHHGYSQVCILNGGVAAWTEAGYQTFTGINVLSKAFGEFVEHRFGTPHVQAAALESRLRAGEDVVVLDSRPFDEFRVMSIPGAIDTPGAELVYRVRDLAPDPSTAVVVNCAGRTRSIIGCQSLINAGIPNSVMALKDGTMGWHLSGLELERGSTRRSESVTTPSHDWAKDAAATVAQRFRVKVVDRQQLAQWRSQTEEKNLYLFDVRQEEEYVGGHLPGARHAAGGQLVQATDMYLAVRNARVVLIDDCGVRARMTASWLNQMGMPEVYVLAPEAWNNGVLETGPEPTSVLGGVPPVDWVEATTLFDEKDTLVIDIAPSLNYRRGHLPGAFWASRSSLSQWVQTLPNSSHYVVSAENDALSALCVADLSALTDRPVSALRGGSRAWSERGFSLESGLERVLVPPEDTYYRPYDREQGKERAMQDYLEWEVALVDQIKKEDTVEFPLFE